MNKDDRHFRKQTFSFKAENNVKKKVFHRSKKGLHKNKDLHIE